MSSKAAKREARIQAARARDSAMLQAGTRDPQTLRNLAGLSEERYQAVQHRALNDSRKPMSPHRTHALAVLGAMATLQRDKIREQIAPQPQPTINDMRRGMGKGPIEGGDVTIAERALGVAG